MSMVVKNNMSAVSTLNTLNKNSSALASSLKKVSSGMKINSAADDASGYAISERMRVQIRGLDQANQNTQNGTSMMKVAEGAVSSTVDILKTLKEKDVYLVHCPESNTNVSTGGIMPVRKYLDEGMHVGIGSDVAGGSTLNLFANLKLAIQLSKIINHGGKNNYKPLTAKEALYLGTLGGASYFGKAGSFMEGYDADILVIDVPVLV